MSHIQGIAKDQYFLLPPLVSEWIPENHPARIVEMFVDSIEVKDLGFSEENEMTGRPSYGPEVMLKIILYGYATGERSSRKLESKTYDDLAYIWLTGDLHPDYRTIARFRQNNTDGLKELLKETLNLYLSVGHTFDGIIFSDGTKIYANASDDKVINAKRINALEGLAEKMLKEAEKADKEEDEKDGDNNSNFIKKDAIRKINEKIIEYKGRLANSNQKTISLTDKESRYMKHARGHGKHLSYNAQISVNKEGIIFEAEVSTKPADDGELLKERVKGVEKNTGKEVKKVIADTGYYETNAVKKITESGKRCIVPKQSTQEKDKENFKYNKKKDLYKCVKKKELKYIRERYDKGKKYIVYAAKKEDCLSCELSEKCYKGKAKGKYGRSIMIYEDRDFTKEYRKTINRNKKLYKKRQYTIEPVIGTIKSGLRFRRFALRGLEKVKAEWSLITVALNLIKIRKLMLNSG